MNIQQNNNNTGGGAVNQEPITPRAVKIDISDLSRNAANRFTSLNSGFAQGEQSLAIPQATPDLNQQFSDGVPTAMEHGKAPIYNTKTNQTFQQN